MCPCLICGGILNVMSKRRRFDKLGRKKYKCRKCKKRYVIEGKIIILYENVEKTQHAIKANLDKM